MATPKSVRVQAVPARPAAEILPRTATPIVPADSIAGRALVAVIAIMATLAKQERVKRSERTKAGLARVKAAGKRLGRPISLNGEHHLAVARLRAQGLSSRAIGRELGISDHSVRRMTAR